MTVTLTSSTSVLLAGDYRFMLMLGHGVLERRPDGWRFGTRRIADHVVERLVNSGRARRDGDRVSLAPLFGCQRPEGE